MCLCVCMCLCVYVCVCMYARVYTYVTRNMLNWQIKIFIYDFLVHIYK